MGINIHRQCHGPKNHYCTFLRSEIGTMLLHIVVEQSVCFNDFNILIFKG